jgi:hypothetical protein
MADVQIVGLDKLTRKMEAWGKRVRSTQTRVGNNIRYGPYVGSSLYQAVVHYGRWATDDDAVEAELPAITKDFQDSVNRAILLPDAIKGNPLRPPAERAGQRVLRRMANYPPPIPGSRYKRTGAYGRRWKVRVRETG